MGILVEVRRGCWIPLDLELHVSVNHRVVAGSSGRIANAMSTALVKAPLNHCI